MFILSYTEDGVPQQYTLPEGDTVIGRAPSCDLTLEHVTISRRHAVAEMSGERCVLRDLGSSNGTCRNQVEITDAELSAGDVVTLGDFPLQVRASSEGHLVLADDLMLVEDGHTICLPVSGVVSVGTVLAHVDGERLLAVVSDIGRLLIETNTLSEMLERVVELVFDCVPAERCFLLLGGGDKEPLTPRVVRERGVADPPQTAISRTIVDRVITDRVALLAINAQLDPRLVGGESIKAQNVRAFMCAPLWYRPDVIGVLYADSPEIGRFSSNDLDLFTALANYAAVAIERSRLSERVLEETRQRERLQRYHSAAVVEQILSTDDDTAFIAQERDVSVLFADLVGFTARAERLPPPQVARLLNSCLACMSDAVFDEAGTLDKFIGDAILAVFGAPLDQPDHHLRAVRAALGIRQRMRELNRERGGDPLAVRVAINSGRAMAGDIGSLRRRDYTVLGDVVNTSSRLESQVAAPDQIVITRATYDHVKEDIAAQSLGRVKLRGRMAEVEVFEVEGLLSRH